MRALVPILLLLAFPATASAVRSAAAPDGPGPKSEVVEGAGLRAELTWTQPAEGFLVEDLQVTVTKDGAPLAQRAFKDRNPGGGYTVTPEPAGSLLLEDLDGDGVAEVAVDTYSGGAHCCLETFVFTADGRKARFRFGNHGYEVADVDKDGRVELVTADDRFAGRFCAYAASFYPRRALVLVDSRFTDVTKSFASLSRADSKRLWKDYRRYRKDACAGRAALAAWAAAEHRLGRGDAALRRVRGLAGRGFERDLRGFLRRAGYR